MKVLFCGLKNDYGQAGRGLSFEYQNFYQVLQNMQGLEVRAFFIDEQIATVGRDRANEHLIKSVEEIKPDLLFCFLFTEELKKETIDYITRKTSTKTFNWFADDHWRFPVYSRHWAPLFTRVATTDSQAVKKYTSIGVRVIKTQWAANTLLYKPLEQSAISKQQSASGKKSYEITFVGKNYGARSQYISFLQRRNLPVTGYGGGWQTGWLDQAKMLEIFSSSKINLNFTESYFSWPKQLAKLFIKKEPGKYLPNIQYPISNLESLIGARRRQIKGRTFEVPACGGFLLTGAADNLGDYYVDGKEIVIFNDKNDLAEKCKYYLSHESERQPIAQAGYERTIKEHTYEKRFGEIFKAMGF